MHRKLTIFFLLITAPALLHSGMLILMDDSQSNHLKAYGLAYQALLKNYSIQWLLNYKGGSFYIEAEDSSLRSWALTRNVRYSMIDAHTYSQIKQIIDSENMNIVKLEKAPEIAVYAPPEHVPWDDAVTLVLKYAEIPYSTIWDEEVLSGKLTIDNYDWLHLHHEDFTGQHGKFWMAFNKESWYQERVIQYDKLAKKWGFKSTQEEKKGVAALIRKYVEEGGFLFAMCSATDTLDIALSSIGQDIIPPEIDGTPISGNGAFNLQYENTLAFEKFQLINSAYIYEFSDIDVMPHEENIYYTPFYFKLNNFAARYDIIPSMLVQNHKNLIKGFLGQTTAYHTRLIKKDIVILDEVEGRDWVTYIHGDRGKGTFTFFAGHDPEDYTHQVGDPPTNLDLFPNSPGYRLILNNILFPAAQTKKKKT